MNNDGVLDSGIPNFTVVDAISWTDGGTRDHMYAASLQGTNIANNRSSTPDIAYRIYDASGNPRCWAVADVLVTATAPNGPFAFDWAGGDYQGGLSQGFGPQALDLGRPNSALSLCADVYGISQANGGTQKLSLDAGSANAGGVFLIIGSLSGTMPGTQLNAQVRAPINADAYTLLLLGAPNSLIQQSVGLLDAQGRTSSNFTLPANSPVTLGMTFNHAAIVADRAFTRFVFASNPTTLFIQS